MKRLLSNDISTGCRIAATALLTLFLFAGMPACCSAAVAHVHEDIESLQKLAESRQEQAIVQLEALKATLNPSASFSDLRTLLDTMITLNIRLQNYAKANALIEELVAAGTRLNDPAAKIIALIHQSKISSRQNNHAKCLEQIEDALDLTPQIAGDAMLVARVEYGAAEAYNFIGDFQMALQHQRLAEERADAIQVKSWQVQLLRARTRFLKGFIYYSSKELQAALNSLNEASNLADGLNVPIFAGQILNLQGASYSFLKQWNLAKTSYLASLKLTQDLGNSSAEGLSYANLADVSISQGNIPDCLRYAQQALEFAQQYQYERVAAVAKGNLGICKIYSGEKVAGFVLLEQSFDYFKKNNALPTLEMMLDEWSAAYAKTGMYKEAWETLQKKIPISEELAQQKRQETAFEMKTQYALGKRHLEIVQKESLESTQATQAERQNLQRIIMLLSGLLVAAIGMMIYRQIHRNGPAPANNTATNPQFQYSRDPLTGLLNRSAFQSVIEMRRQLKNRRQAVSDSVFDIVLLIEIDHFKPVSINIGPQRTDELLVEVARNLEDSLRDRDLLIRWSGSQFLVFLNSVPVEKIESIVERELNAIGKIQQIKIEDFKISITASAGYLTLPSADAAAIEWLTVFDCLDAVLNMAKSTSGNQAFGITGTTGNDAGLIALLNKPGKFSLEDTLQSGTVRVSHIPGPNFHSA